MSESAGNNTRFDLRNDDFGHRLKRRAPEVESGIGEVWIERAQFWHNRQYDKWRTKHDMRQ